MSTFRLVGLPPEPFRPLFDLSDDALARRGIRRVVADAHPGYPCRVGLVDAEPGETLLLLPFEHHATTGPYRASGPIYVRAAAGRRIGDPGEVPDSVRSRLISVRGYDCDGMMVEADVCDGRDVADRLDRLFANRAVRYAHLHNARQGCYSCRAERVSR